MNGRERFLAALAGEPADTLPIVPVVDGFYAPKVIGRDNDECFLDGDCMAAALTAARERYGYDGILAEMGLGDPPSVLGCPVEVQGNDVPLVVETLVDGPGDLEKIGTPDPWAGGKMEPVQKVVEAAAGRHAVLGSVRSPFEYAATVRGLAGFMTDFYRDPDFVHRLIRAMLPATVVTAQALAQAGVDAVVIKDSFASSSVISPDHYREFAFPYEVEAIAELGGEVPVILHICRNSGPILAQMAQTGADALEVDSLVDLAAAREAVGPGITLKGNIDAVAVLEKGTVADVEAAVRRAAAAADGRFILSSGDSIPRETPDENLAALVEYGRKYGS